MGATCSAHKSYRNANFWLRNPKEKKTN